MSDRDESSKESKITEQIIEEHLTVKEQRTVSILYDRSPTKVDNTTSLVHADDAGEGGVGSGMTGFVSGDPFGDTSLVNESDLSILVQAKKKLQS